MMFSVSLPDLPPPPPPDKKKSGMIEWPLPRLFPPSPPPDLIRKNIPQVGSENSLPLPPSRVVGTTTERRGRGSSPGWRARRGEKLSASLFWASGLLTHFKRKEGEGKTGRGILEGLYSDHSRHSTQTYGREKGFLP